tara:strand:+ start:173 stop:556 length:384 start_codon:yes stop_codon:yes gene_type:complete
MKNIKKYIDDLYWEYDRMSSSGKETLDKMAREVDLEIPITTNFTRYYFKIDTFKNSKEEKKEFQGMYVYLQNKADLQKDSFDYNVGIMHNKNGNYYAMIDRTEYLSSDLSEIEEHIINFIQKEKIYG